MQPALALRHFLMLSGLCRYGTNGAADLPLAYLEDLPPLTTTGKSALGIFTSPGLGDPGISLPYDLVTVRVVVRIDAGNTYDSNTAGRGHAETIRNYLHGIGDDGHGFAIGPDDAAVWVSNLLARDTAPIALGPETGSTVPRWSVVFTADVHNPSAHRQEIAQ